MEATWSDILLWDAKKWQALHDNLQRKTVQYADMSIEVQNLYTSIRSRGEMVSETIMRMKEYEAVVSDQQTRLYSTYLAVGNFINKIDLVCSLTKSAQNDANEAQLLIQESGEVIPTVVGLHKVLQACAIPTCLLATLNDRLMSMPATNWLEGAQSLELRLHEEILVASDSVPSRSILIDLGRSTLDCAYSQEEISALIWSQVFIAPWHQFVENIIDINSLINSAVNTANQADADFESALRASATLR